MAQRRRDYAAEYAQRKRNATRRGFTSVRRERGARADYRAAATARGESARVIENRLRGGAAREAGVRRGSPRANAGLDPMEKAERYRLDEFSRSYVMSHWEEFGWFDSWDEARE